MDVWQWVVIATVLVLLLAAASGWWKRWPRRNYTVDHIRVELHPAHIVDDRVIEAVWRAAISMTNRSRRPRAVPVLAERATVHAGRRIYLADICLESDVREINPGDVAHAWVAFALPSDRAPGSVELVKIGAAHQRIRVRCLGNSREAQRPLVTI